MLDNIWHKCLKKLQIIIPEQQFIQYISPLQIKIKKKNIILYAPNNYILDKINNNYLTQIKTIIKNSTKKTYEIELKVGTKYIENKIKNKTKIKKKRVKNNLNKDLNIKNFIKGNSNKLATLTGITIINNLGNKYNPFYIYGKSGTGKTHFINAIGNLINSKKPNYKILYTNAEKFVLDMVSSIQKNKISEFKKFYRSRDLLIIDDIQYLSGKKKSQEEFLYTINNFIERQKQIIITSNKSPDEIKIKDELKYRLLSGLIVKIKKPKTNTIMKILKNKANFLNIKIKKNFLKLIAKKKIYNIRELEGILKYITSYTNVYNSKITKKLINNLINKSTKKINKQIPIEKILNEVSKYYNIKTQNIISKKRNKSTVKARQILFFLCKKLTKNSLSEIGTISGGFNNTTVLYSYKKILEIIKKKTHINKEIKQLIKIIKT